jgi:hypothetical protein
MPKACVVFRCSFPSVAAPGSDIGAVRHGAPRSDLKSWHAMYQAVGCYLVEAHEFRHFRLDWTGSDSQVKLDLVGLRRGARFRWASSAFQVDAQKQENSGDSMHAKPHLGTWCHYQFFR